MKSDKEEAFRDTRDIFSTSGQEGTSRAIALISARMLCASRQMSSSRLVKSLMRSMPGGSTAGPARQIRYSRQTGDLPLELEGQPGGRPWFRDCCSVQTALIISKCARELDLQAGHTAFPSVAASCRIKGTKKTRTTCLRVRRGC